jgi:hypothetical protein
VFTCLWDGRCFDIGGSITGFQFGTGQRLSTKPNSVDVKAASLLLRAMFQVCDRVPLYRAPGLRLCLVRVLNGSQRWSEADVEKYCRPLPIDESDEEPASTADADAYARFVGKLVVAYKRARERLPFVEQLPGHLQIAVAGTVVWILLSGSTQQKAMFESIAYAALHHLGLWPSQTYRIWIELAKFEDTVPCKWSVFWRQAAAQHTDVDRFFQLIKTCERERLGWDSPWTLADWVAGLALMPIRWAAPHLRSVTQRTFLSRIALRLQYLVATHQGACAPNLTLCVWCESYLQVAQKTSPMQLRDAKLILPMSAPFLSEESGNRALRTLPRAASHTSERLTLRSCLRPNTGPVMCADRVVSHMNCLRACFHVNTLIDSWFMMFVVSFCYWNPI